MLLTALAGTAAAAELPCRPLDGDYLVVGDGQPRGDSLQALQAERAGFIDSQIRMRTDADGTLLLWFNSGAGEPFPVQVSHRLSPGIDFECRNGWWQLRRPATGTWRRLDDRYLEGSSRIALARGSSGELQIRLQFEGRERSTLYSYDSARISIGIPGTSARVEERLSWPDPARQPPPPPAPAAPAPEPAALRELRNQLTRVLPAGVQLVALDASGAQASAQFKASRSENAVALEDALHRAGIGYQLRREPGWSGNGWHIDMRLATEASAAPARWTPSLFRVAYDLDRYGDPSFVTARPSGANGDYRVMLRSPEGRSPDHYIARLQHNSSLFSRIEVLTTQRDGQALTVELGLTVD